MLPRSLKYLTHEITVTASELYVTNLLAVRGTLPTSTTALQPQVGRQGTDMLDLFGGPSLCHDDMDQTEVGKARIVIVAYKK